MIPNAVVLEPFSSPLPVPIVPLAVEIVPSSSGGFLVVLAGSSIGGSSATYQDLNGLSAYNSASDVIARASSENLSGLFIDASINQTEINTGQDVTAWNQLGWANGTLYGNVDVVSNTRAGSTLQLTGETLIGQLSRKPAPSKIYEKGPFTPQAALTLILTRWGIPFVPIPEMVLRGSSTPVVGGVPPSLDGFVRPVLGGITITWEDKEQPPSIRSVLEEYFSVFDGYYFRMNTDNVLAVIAPPWKTLAAPIVLANTDLEYGTWSKDVRDDLVINRCEVSSTGFEFAPDQTIAADSIVELGGTYLTEGGSPGDPTLPAFPRDVFTGVWKATTNYASGDAVSYNGKRYRRWDAFNIPYVAAEWNAPWEYTGSPPVFNLGSSYNKKDVVQRTGYIGITPFVNFYRALQEVPSNTDVWDLSTHGLYWQPFHWEISRYNGFYQLNEAVPVKRIPLEATALIDGEIELEVLIEWRRRYWTALAGYAYATGTATRFITLGNGFNNETIAWQTNLFPVNRVDSISFFFNVLDRTIEISDTIVNTGSGTTRQAMTYLIKIKTRGSKFQKSNTTSKAVFGDDSTPSLTASRAAYGVRSKSISIGAFKLEIDALLSIAQSVVEQNLQPPNEFKGNLCPPFRLSNDALGQLIQLPDGTLGTLEAWQHSESYQAGSSQTSTAVKIRQKM